jgi:hypothetical protein
MVIRLEFFKCVDASLDLTNRLHLHLFSSSSLVIMASVFSMDFVVPSFLILQDCFHLLVLYMLGGSALGEHSLVRHHAPSYTAVQDKESVDTHPL